MDRGLWKRCKTIFEQAIMLEAGEREIFLDEACGSDKELRRQLDSLLSCHDHAEDFLENPLWIVEENGRTDQASEK